MILEQLGKEQANGQNKRAEIKKIVTLPDLPEQLSAILAALQDGCQTLFAAIPFYSHDLLQSFLKILRAFIKKHLTFLQT